MHILPLPRNGSRTWPVIGIIVCFLLIGSGTAAYLLNVHADSPVTFLGTDTVTQGSWTGFYGSDGYQVIGGTTSLPSYATVTPADALSWTYADGTTDTRALYKSSTDTSRIASIWYTGVSNAYTIDMNLTDGRMHKVSLYAADWDTKSRAERVDVLDTDGTVLDSRAVPVFIDGTYLSWNVSGHVVFRMTNTTTNNTGDLIQNAVISGLFFDPAASTVPPASPSATLSLSPASLSVPSGSTFMVDAVLNTGGQAVAGTEEHLQYSSNLEFVSADVTGSILPQEVLTASDPANRTLTFSRVRLDSGFTGSGRIVRLTFRAVSAGTATVTVNPATSLVLEPENGGNMLQSVANGSYTVTSSGQTPSCGDSVCTAGTETCRQLSGGLRHLSDFFRAVLFVCSAGFLCRSATDWRRWRRWRRRRRRRRRRHHRRHADGHLHRKGSTESLHNHRRIILILLVFLAARCRSGEYRYRFPRAAGSQCTGQGCDALDFLPRDCHPDPRRPEHPVVLPVRPVPARCRACPRQE